MGTHLITGAGSGIGAVVAERLLARGEDVLLLARDARRAAELRERFAGAATLVGDLGDPAKLSWAFGHQSLPVELDSLLHIAGVVELGHVGDLPVKAWQEQLNVNAVAPAEITRLLLPSLRQARGHVVFVNSGAGLRADANWSAYAASKFAVRALADALRAEEHGNGVRVTTVYPGRTATPMQEKVHRQEGRAYDPAQWIAPESVATAILTAIDLPRDAELTEITVRPGR
ncbi:SDR family oxidoreductase [Kitasatospora sp. DSM 101779]|uniref:SDR family oxidoreductase n=1 Tax=Kitasatospora sp. DSM 101779 TaxID=2853165 RepID=UPI0021D92BAF|nr:SDR family oxidoreductase [Kitasatospora sp. DSM 101779]MCU7822744.1 SDR family oxidoreductase [Kitasatospora sp. DSM 101779]